MTFLPQILVCTSYVRSGRLSSSVISTVYNIASFVKFERSRSFTYIVSQTGICWPPVSGSSSSFLAHSWRGSRSPASAGSIAARALSGSPAAAEQSDPEQRSFRRILRRRRDIPIRASTFSSLLEIYFLVLLLLPRSSIDISLFDILISRST